METQSFINFYLVNNIVTFFYIRHSCTDIIYILYDVNLLAMFMYMKSKYVVGIIFAYVSQTSIAGKQKHTSQVQ